MRIDLKAKRWINDDKDCCMNSDFFMGTSMQSFGDLKGYNVNMIFLGMAIPTKKVGTYEDAKKLENDIWETMEKGE